jgi:hypothetical protein
LATRGSAIVWQAAFPARQIFRESRPRPLGPRPGAFVIQEYVMSRPNSVAYASLLVFSWLLVACETASLESPLIGTWETETGTAGMQFRYVFESDGSMQSAAIMGGMTSPQSGTWRVIESAGGEWTVEFTIDTGRRGSTATEQMHIRFRDHDHITLVPAGAGRLASQLSRELARVSN